MMGWARGGELRLNAHRAVLEFSGPQHSQGDSHVL